MLGHNESYTKDQFHESDKYFQPGHGRNPGGPLSRLVRSILITNMDTQMIKKKDNTDFRTAIALNIFLGNSLEILFERIEDLDMRNEMRHDSRKLNFWAKILAKQINDESGPARRRIGYVRYRYDMTH